MNWGKRAKKRVETGAHDDGLLILVETKERGARKRLFCRLSVHFSRVFFACCSPRRCPILRAFYNYLNAWNRLGFTRRDSTSWFSLPPGVGTEDVKCSWSLVVIWKVLTDPLTIFYSFTRHITTFAKTALVKYGTSIWWKSTHFAQYHWKEWPELYEINVQWICVNINPLEITVISGFYDPLAH